VLAGGTVLVAHEAVSDTPAFLATRRLMRRFACVVPEAAALAELFLALEPGPGVVTHYEDEAARIGTALVMGDLVHLVAQLALAEEVPQNDALEHADALGDGVDLVDHAGGIAHATGQPAEEAAPSAVQWHALGTVHAERATCPVCRAVYEADDDASELPTCSGCGTRDTWEARQGGRFRGIVGAIDACRSLEELAQIGKRLYGLALTHEQAGVAWSHYRLGKTAARGGGRTWRAGARARGSDRGSAGGFAARTRGVALPAAARGQRRACPDTVAADLVGVPRPPVALGVGRGRARAPGRLARGDVRTRRRGLRRAR